MGSLEFWAFFALQKACVAKCHNRENVQNGPFSNQLQAKNRISTLGKIYKFEMFAISSLV